MDIENKKFTETIQLGVMMALIGGFLDAYTYFARGGVFATAQTGNIVLLGIDIAQGNFSDIIRLLFPITAFVLGIVLAEIIKRRFNNFNKIHWQQIIVMFELLTLLLVAFIPHNSHGDMIATILVAFVASLQTQTFRKMGGIVAATTMCTGNMRSATEHFFNYLATRKKKQLVMFLQFTYVTVAFMLGATLGAIFTDLLLIKAVLFACLGLLIVFLLLFISEKEHSTK